MLRAKCTVSMAVGLLAGMAALTNPAQASTVAIDLSISYFATIPGNPVLPGPPQIFVGTQLINGNPLFFGSHADAMPLPFTFPTLNVGDIFSTTFEPPDPCIAAASCQLHFNFGGQVTGQDANGLAFSYVAAAIFPGDAIVPTPPPIKIGALDFSYPTPPPIRVAGFIYAFDDPEVVGEWQVTLRVDTTPLPAALPLFATGLGALGLLGWRRKRKALAA
jgi:hypothetical protein